MSVGPLGAEIPERPSGPGYFRMGPSHHRLRVTIVTCERDAWAIVDDLSIGRADSRSVLASYAFRPMDLSDLWGATEHAPRILGSEPIGPPIAWQSPTTFAWISRSDTLVCEQVTDSAFNVTLRARIR
jgi:hypothetical protein